MAINYFYDFFNGYINYLTMATCPNFANCKRCLGQTLVTVQSPLKVRCPFTKCDLLLAAGVAVPALHDHAGFLGSGQRGRELSDVSHVGKIVHDD